MSTFTTRRTVKKCTTPAEVIHECLLDIRDGLWVCGTLSKNNTTCTHVEKPLGCAVGMVGINTGHCEWELLRNDTFQFLIKETWENEDGYMWDDPLAKKCIEILAEASLTISDWHRENYVDSMDLWVYDNDGNTNIPSLEKIVAYMLESDPQDCVITYNDGNIDREQATAWFQLALEMAQSGR